MGFHSVQPHEPILKVLSGYEVMGLQEGETDDNQDGRSVKLGMGSSMEEPLLRSRMLLVI